MTTYYNTFTTRLKFYNILSEAFTIQPRMTTNIITTLWNWQHTDTNIYNTIKVYNHSGPYMPDTMLQEITMWYKQSHYLQSLQHSALSNKQSQCQIITIQSVLLCFFNTDTIGIFPRGSPTTSVDSYACPSLFLMDRTRMPATTNGSSVHSAS